MDTEIQYLKQELLSLKAKIAKANHESYMRRRINKKLLEHHSSH